MKAVILATLFAAVSAFTSSPQASVSRHRYTCFQVAKLLSLTNILIFLSHLQFVSKTALNAKQVPSKLEYCPCIPLSDLPKPGKATSGVAGGLAICIAVDSKGSVFALGDKCPPINQPLSFGKVNADGTIEDPLLGTKFSLKTGDVVSWCPSGIGKILGGAFSPTGVPVYPVRQRGGNIEVQVDVNAKFNFEANYWSGVLDAQGKDSGTYY